MGHAKISILNWIHQIFINFNENHLLTMRNSNSLKQTMWIGVFDINFHQFSMIFIKFFKNFQNFVIMQKYFLAWNSSYRIFPDLSLSESEASRCHVLDLGFSNHSLDEILNWGSIFQNFRTYFLLASESLFSPGNYNLHARGKPSTMVTARRACRDCWPRAMHKLKNLPGAPRESQCTFA